MKKRKFRLFDAILATVCIILVAESVAPAASIGNSQYFWWILLLIGFFLPYGLISAELGSAYPSEGGMYDWVKRAFGKKWAARVAWYYWINFPLWISALALLTTDILAQLLDIEFSLGALLAICFAYIGLVTIAGFFRIGDSKWLVNIGALFKVVMMSLLGFLGIYVAINYGFANEYTLSSMLPSLDFVGIGFISVIIFNFMGFEVISTFSNDMENPRKEIPKAILVGGILIAIFYLLPAFGIGVAIPYEEISTSTGIVDSFSLLLGSIGLSEGFINGFIWVIGIMFIYTLVANVISWSFGINSVARYSALDGSLPKPFTEVNKDGVPYKTAIINAVVAAVVVIAALLIENEDAFWTFFAFSLITFLLSYAPLFPAFLKLRKTDASTERPYMAPIKEGFLGVFSYVPLVLLLAGIFFTLFPEFNGEMLEYQWPLLVGVAIAIIIGEVIAYDKK